MPIVCCTTEERQGGGHDAADIARNEPTRGSSARIWNTPRAPQKPAIRPMTTATGAKKAMTGPAPPGTGSSAQIRFDSSPVRAPAHGPPSTPTSTVPMESR